MARKIFKGFLIFIAVLMALVAAMVGSIDRTPLAEQEFYLQMMAQLDTTSLKDHGNAALRSGWTKVNITPSGQSPMAGYIPRDHYENVHDSLYARILVLDNGSFRCAMINVDLLIFPPALRDRIRERLEGTGTFLYLSATHTHNGVGGWDPSIGGRLITGKYSEEWLDLNADKIASAVRSITVLPSGIRYFQSDARDLIENRLDFDSGKVDGLVRGFRIDRDDSTRAIWFTYGAHSTSILKEVLDLSADYPGRAIELLEEDYDFGMFMSGMVGSHRFQWHPYYNYQLIDTLAPKLVSRIRRSNMDSLVFDPAIRSAQIPIVFGPSQLRIDKNWKINDWAFRTLFGKLKGELTYLEIGDIIFIGTPCDFSGEIYTIDSLGRKAEAKGKHLVITSFNGDYAGYITYDGHYEKSTKEEINALNWVGPYYGAYFSGVIERIIDK